MKLSLALASLISAALAVDTFQATPFLTSSNSQFGGGIEGAGVDRAGNIYAVNFNGQSASTGQVSPSQSLLYRDTGSALFNGIRFHIDSSGKEEAFVADATGHRVVRLTNRNASGVFQNSAVLCQDAGILQPNDIAIAHSTGRIFMSGMNYQATDVIGNGDLWTCDSSGKATKLGVFYRTNGIEVSPDEKTLYLSEAANKDWAVVSNIIYAFDLDAKAGTVTNKRVFADFGKLDNTASTDIDGMRTDTQGNLYVARNGIGKVAKLSPSGQLLAYITTPGHTSVTNLEFGGAAGTDLYIVGACADNTSKGCVSVYKGSAVGTAFSKLQGAGPITSSTSAAAVTTSTAATTALPATSTSPASSTRPANTSSPITSTTATGSGTTCDAAMQGKFQCTNAGSSPQYSVCNNGTWLQQSCAGGTVCKQSGSSIYCDWA
ncbi:hypothetical protein FBU59_003560 [Linderina macrospora]|uniref:Uncharacterized protein n=1 Tax=Linderina macrospora TaxID=4868 RepID=A0ACC1J861_9FUNG|nr:hypothetical protein FBU59_003560 [Linderina macrospora]